MNMAPQQTQQAPTFTQTTPFQQTQSTQPFIAPTFVGQQSFANAPNVVSPPQLGQQSKTLFTQPSQISVQPNITGAGFGGFPQPLSNFPQTTLSSIPQESVATFQQNQPISPFAAATTNGQQLQPQTTNPFRQSVVMQNPSQQPTPTFGLPASNQQQP